MLTIFPSYSRTFARTPLELLLLTKYILPLTLRLTDPVSAAKIQDACLLVIPRRFHTFLLGTFVRCSPLRCCQVTDQSGEDYLIGVHGNPEACSD